MQHCEMFSALVLGYVPGAFQIDRTSEWSTCSDWKHLPFHAYSRSIFPAHISVMMTKIMLKIAFCSLQIFYGEDTRRLPYKAHAFDTHDNAPHPPPPPPSFQKASYGPGQVCLSQSNFKIIAENSKISNVTCINPLFCGDLWLSLTFKGGREIWRLGIDLTFLCVVNMFLSTNWKQPRYAVYRLL